MTMDRRNIAVTGFVVLGLALDAGGQGIAWRQLKPSDILKESVEIHPYTRIGLTDKQANQDVIEGERLFEDQVLVADRIVFRPGSRLIFGPGAVGDRSARYIVARTVVVQPGAMPTITWQRGPSLPEPPPFSVKAAPGTIGAVDGAPGGAGANGAPGNPGFPGRSAPTLYVFAGRIEGGPIQVDLRGQDGGRGGIGQDGGDGGPGRAGRRGVSSLVDCRSVGDNGGRGGAAGNGGIGGAGGRGGIGGIFILVSTTRALAVAKEAFRVDTAAGAGGPGGPGGKPGQPGVGGQGGSGSLRCDGGRRGSDGDSGQSGAEGPTGFAGEAGELAVVEMGSDTQFNRAVSPQ